MKGKILVYVCSYQKLIIYFPTATIQCLKVISQMKIYIGVVTMSLHIVWRWRACRVPQNISILRQNDGNGGSKDYIVTKRKNVEDKYSCKNACIYTR